MRGLKARTLQAQCPINHLAPKFNFVRYCPKADKRWRSCIVRFVPEADIHHSFDHHV